MDFISILDGAALIKILGIGFSCLLVFTLLHASYIIEDLGDEEE